MPSALPRSGKSIARLAVILVLATAVVVGVHYWLDGKEDAPERWVGEDGFVRLIYSGSVSNDPLSGIATPGQRNGARRPQPMSSAELEERLFRDPATPVGGNPAGRIAIVVFSDYRCPYCRVVAPELKRLTERDDRVRIVYKEWPILGDASRLAARAALAAHRQDGYEAFHHRMMAMKGLPTMDLLRTVAEETGLDWVRLERDMDDAAIGAALERTHALARQLAIAGTPTFVVDKTIVEGAVPIETLLSLHEEGSRRGR